MSTESLTKSEHGSPQPAHRKRRVASLTAQTLWNIQMEDDITGKIAEEFYFSDDEIFQQIEKSIPLRQSAKNKGSSSSSNDERKNGNNNKVPKKRGRKRKCEVLKKKQDVQANKAKANTVFTTSNTSTTFTRKGKLTAAVAPLVKTPSNFGPHGTGSSSSPMFSSHKQRYNQNQLPFDNRFKEKALTCVKCQKQLIDFNSPIFGQSFNSYFDNSTCTHQPITQFCRSGAHDADAAELQEQPLNLKLGETSIPSKLALPNSEKMSPSVCATDASNNSIQRISKIETIHNLPLNWCKDKGNSSSYDASSPASTTGSSCSTESDELRPGTPNGIKRRRKSSQKVNLRVIAAPPPGSDARRQTAQSRKSPFYAKRSKKPLKKTTGRLTVLPVIDNTPSEASNNGWRWDGKPYYSNVFSMKDLKPVKRRCYPAMRRKAEKPGMGDDVVMVRDCVLLLADDNYQQSYVAKVASLWQHPSTGAMMISVLWFYRPEHTEDSKVLDHVMNYSDDELFASRHLDEISVACVEDKCYVLTYAQYCRYTCSQSRKSFVNEDPRIHMFSQTLRDKRRVLPHQRVPEIADPNLVYFSRKFYDIKLRRVLKSLPPPTPLYEKST